MAIGYDNPNFLVVRFSTPVNETGANGSLSAAAVSSEYAGSTLKVYQKAAILGCSFQVQSGAGSAVGTNSISISRIISGGANSIWGTKTLVTSLGASMANDVVDISLASAMTLSSIGDIAQLWAVAASVHKCVVIKNVVWRYRLLPQDLPVPE
jgi:hypothetical protein